MFTNDGGVKWLLQSSNTGYDLEGVYFVDPGKGWAVGKCGSRGTSVVTESNRTGSRGPRNRRRPNGADGIILHTVDSGADWNSQESGVSSELYSVCFIDPEEGWVVGQSGTILHTNNGGETWKPEGSGTNRNLYRVVYVEGNGLIAIGANSTILRRKVDGANVTTAANMR
jgi:photosystem II stability/assembly factor-like uncharacterized protein